MVRKPKEEDLEEVPASINPYEILGLEEEAAADQIKSAYRKQALKHHPG
jgi:DnaJ family protein C protein 9